MNPLLVQRLGMLMALRSGWDMALCGPPWRHNSTLEAPVLLLRAVNQESLKRDRLAHSPPGRASPQP